MYVIRRRTHGSIYHPGEFLSRKPDWVAWDTQSAFARCYSTRAEAEAAREILVLTRCFPDTYQLDCIPLEKET
jgi:hypothetical protein